MYVKNKRRIWFITISVSLGFALALLVLEVALRSEGHRRHAEITAGNPTPDFSPNEIRILTLGESTSARFVVEGEDRSWPRRLESVLGEQFPRFKVKVFNYATPGTNTFNLVQLAGILLEEIKPQFVITMMGVNDHTSLEYLRDRGLGSLRVVKGFKWAIHSIRRRLRGEIEGMDPSERERLRFRIAEITGYRLAPLNFDDLENALDSLPRTSSREKWTTDLEIAVKILQILQLDGNIPPTAAEELKEKFRRGLRSASKYALSAFQIHPSGQETVETLIELGRLGSGEGYPDITRAKITEAFENGLELNPVITKYLSENSGEPAFAKILSSTGLTVNPQKWPYQSTMRNYRDLFEMVNSRGARLIVMQYPLGRMEGLLNIFALEPALPATFCAATRSRASTRLNPHYESVRFVSNNNFNERIDKEGYWTYFFDQFSIECGGQFGHTNPRGHGLIVENLMTSLKPELEKLGNAVTKR